MRVGEEAHSSGEPERALGQIACSMTGCLLSQVRMALGHAAVDEVNVAGPLFDATEPGDAVCVAVRGGALGIRWYDVYGADACAEAGS